MKKKFSFICITAILFSSCTKQKATEELFKKVEVFETGTNMPVADASVRLSHCTDYDLEFGCQEVGVFASYPTNAEGVALVKNQDYYKANEGIKIEKAGYWTQGGAEGRNSISSEAWITAVIRRVNTYPDDKRFYLFVADEYRRVTQGVKVTEVMQHDTTITFKCFGAQVNHIKWLVGQEIIVFGWNNVYTIYDTVAVNQLAPVQVSKGGNMSINIEY